MTNISIEQLMCISDEQLKRLRSVKNVQQVKLGNFSAADCVFTNAGGIGIVIEVPLNTDTDEVARDIRDIITNRIPFGISYKGC